MYGRAASCHRSRKLRSGSAFAITETELSPLYPVFTDLQKKAAPEPLPMQIRGMWQLSPVLGACRLSCSICASRNETSRSKRSTIFSSRVTTRMVACCVWTTWRGSWLVGQDDVWPDGQRPRDRHPLRLLRATVIGTSRGRAARSDRKRLASRRPAAVG